MKSKILLFALLLILPLHGSYAYNEPDSFMGIKFWHPIRESLKECRKERIGGVEYYNRGKDPDRACWEVSASGEQYEIRLTTDGWIATGLSHVYAYEANKKLAFLELDFHWEMYPRVLAVFRERYGSPTRILTEQWTSQLGLSVPNQVVLWQGKRVSIMLRQRGPSADRGYGAYETYLWREYAAKKQGDDIKKSAKGL